MRQVESGALRGTNSKIFSVLNSLILLRKILKQHCGLDCIGLEL